MTSRPSHQIALFGIILSLLACETASSLAQTPATQPTAASLKVEDSPLILRGKTALSDGRFKEAREIFLKAADENPKDYVALHGAGVAALYLRDDQQANRMMAKAVALAPVADRALSYNYAVADMNLKNYRRAAQTLRDYLYANPKVLDEQLCDALGALLYQTGESNSANRVSDDCRKFYSVYVKMLEAKRPGLKKWGPQWQPAAEVDVKAGRMREAEMTIALLTQDAQAAQGNVEKKRIDFREQQEKAARLSAARTVVDLLRPDYPQLLLPIDMDAKKAAPFEEVAAVPPPSPHVKAALPKATEPSPPTEEPKKVTMVPALRSPQPTASVSEAPSHNEAAAPAPSVGVAGIDASILRQCQIAADGTISTEREVKLTFAGTEQKDFVLSGEIFLGGSDEAGGALFCFREADGMHRYEVTGKGLRAKRVLLEGQPVKQFANPIKFEMPKDRWVPFRFEFSTQHIVLTLDGNTATANGPISSQGGNGVLLRPGGKLRALQLDVAKP